METEKKTLKDVGSFNYSGDVFQEENQCHDKANITHVYCLHKQKPKDQSKKSKLLVPDYRKQLYLKPYVCPPCSPPLPLISEVTEKEAVSKFVATVLLLLTVQLVVTLVILSICYYCHRFQEFVTKNWWFIGMNIFVFCISYYTLVVSTIIKYNPLKYTKLYRKCKCFQFPVNAPGCILMTMSVAFIIGMCTMHWSTQIIIAAGLCILFLCITAAMIAIFTRFDFTSYFMYGYLLIAVLVLSGLAAMLAWQIHQFVSNDILYACLIVFFYCGFTILALHMILGGRSLEVKQTDYFLAAAMLYTNIIFVFINYLNTLGL